LGEYPLVIDPAAVQEKRSDRGRAGALALAGAAVLLVSLLVGWQLDRQKTDTERRGRADRLGREIERDRKTLSRLQGERDRLRERFKLVSGGPAAGSGPAALEALRTVAARAPEGVWLTQVSYERDRPLELQGTARDAGRATRFLEALEGTPGFRRVELSYLRSDTQENRPVTRFRIECWRGGDMYGQTSLASMASGTASGTEVGQ
jgi:Tfp pilus assembly protein PilN